MRPRPVHALALVAIFAAPVAGAALGIVKSAAVVTDGVSTLNPRALPGASVDYTLLVTNPAANIGAPVRREVVTDALADGVALRVADLGTAGSGPVEFRDGNLLGNGLTGSGLSYAFTGLASTTDDVDFSDGVSWTYAPVADAAGLDARVRAIRVTLRGTHATGAAFRLRYRVVIR
jgi:hypothetical protein